MYRSTLALKVLVISATVALASCSHLPSIGFPGVYKINVQQGNVVEKKFVDQLKIGMTKKHVRFVMGTPLIVDTFNQNRWDYFYSLKTGKGEYEQKKVVLIFQDDKLASFNAEVPPANSTANSLKDNDDYGTFSEPESIRSAPVHNH